MARAESGLVFYANYSERFVPERSCPNDSVETAWLSITLNPVPALLLPTTANLPLKAARKSLPLTLIQAMALVTTGGMLPLYSGASKISASDSNSFPIQHTCFFGNAAFLDSRCEKGDVQIFQLDDFRFRTAFFGQAHQELGQFQICSVCGAEKDKFLHDPSKRGGIDFFDKKTWMKQGWRESGLERFHEGDEELSVFRRHCLEGGLYFFPLPHHAKGMASSTLRALPSWRSRECPFTVGNKQCPKGAECAIPPVAWKSLLPSDKASPMSCNNRSV